MNILKIFEKPTEAPGPVPVPVQVKPVETLPADPLAGIAEDLIVKRAAQIMGKRGGAKRKGFRKIKSDNLQQVA